MSPEAAFTSPAGSSRQTDYSYLLTSSGPEQRCSPQKSSPVYRAGGQGSEHVSSTSLQYKDVTVRTLPLLLDSDKVDTLDLEERLWPDSDPDSDLDPADLALRPLFDDLPDLTVRPDLAVRSDPEEMVEISERSDLEDSSEMEVTLVLESGVQTDHR